MEGGKNCSERVRWREIRVRWCRATAAAMERGVFFSGELGNLVEW